MKVHTKLTTAFRRVSSSWLIVLVLAPLAAVSARAQQKLAPDEVEIRTVMDSAAPCLNVRERPSYSARIVGCVDSGSTVKVTGVSRGWSHIIFDQELRGWAGTRFLAGGPTPPRPAERRPEPESGEPSEPPMERRMPPSEPSEAGAVDPDEVLRVSAEHNRAQELLAAAHLRVEQLEAEVDALREQARRGAEDSTRLEAVRAERDDLADQLAHSEARQLYLQSDLEETRGELMRLKGIPPKLVQVEEPPAPEPLPPIDEPEPEVEVEEAAGEAAIQRPEIASVVSMDEAVATVRAWARAWSEQRADGYLSFYSADFTPADGSSREAWSARRRARIEAPRSIEVTLVRINPIVLGDRATVSFVQSYRSDSFEDVVEKTLVLERTDGHWRIVKELAR